VETGDRDLIATWKARLGMNPNRALHDQLRLPLPSKPNSRGVHTSIIEGVRWIIGFPDTYKGWVPFAVESLQQLSRAAVPDVILSTSPPASAQLIGARAQRILRRPWVADFRDLWSQQPFDGARRALRPFHQRLERKTLRAASALVTVSEPWARQLGNCYPEKPVYAITNGFDPDEFSPNSQNLTREFSLTYTGFLYQGKRDPSQLFAALQELLSEGRIARADLRVRFFGPPEAWLYRLVDHYQLQGVVEIRGEVPRAEALQCQAESQILLLLGWSDLRETGQHTGKLFEYFGTRRPILAVGGARGVLTETLEQTKAGVHALSKEQLRENLLASYEQFRRQGSVSYAADEVALSRYTHLEMARAMSRVLASVVQPSLSPDANVLQEMHPLSLSTP
jgi:glycosyltransferase involved in cell wall biosynthesis